MYCDDELTFLGFISNTHKPTRNDFLSVGGAEISPFAKTYRVSHTALYTLLCLMLLNQAILAAVAESYHLELHYSIYFYRNEYVPIVTCHSTKMKCFLWDRAYLAKWL